MNTSGDAAEQIVRLSLEGTEIALKLTGSAAKNVAAALFAIYKNRDKTKVKGYQRLTSMLKSGKELKVFTIDQEHLKQFATESKRYGVVYCALKEKNPSADGMVDVMVRAEDASKINRIVERFKLSTVDSATIKSEIERGREKAAAVPDAPEIVTLPKSKEEQLLDELLEAPTQKEAPAAENPAAAKTAPSPPSEPTSKQPSKSGAEAAKSGDTRPSVREELKRIQFKRKTEENGQKPPHKEQDKPQKQSGKSHQHKQPKKKKKNPKNRKER